MIILLLIKRIVSLFLIMAAGMALVKFKIVKAEDSKILSALCIYLIIPCTIINAFQIDYSKEIQSGILLALIAALIVHAGFLLLTPILSRIFHMNPVEVMSVDYPNAVNMLLPIVIALWGNEYIIYTSPFTIVQLCMLWSHGRSLISGEKGIQLKKIFLNINMITVIIGLILFFGHIRLPDVLQSSVETIGSSIAPVSMLLTGMLVSSLSLKDILKHKKIWAVAAMRLLGCPLAALAIFRLFHLSSMAAQSQIILAISLLSTASPSANCVIQMSQVYGHEEDARYASMINIVTVILCIVTMPAILSLYMATA